MYNSNQYDAWTPMSCDLVQWTNALQGQGPQTSNGFGTGAMSRHMRPIVGGGHAKQCTSMPIPPADTLANVENELEQMILSGRRQPPPEYICHACYTPGHYIHDCTKRLLAQSADTPYQGPRTSFGMYECDNCKHKWQSPKSGRNVAQRCNKCKQMVLPRKQYAIEKALTKGLYRPRPDSAYSTSSAESSNASDRDVFGPITRYQQ